MFNRTVEQLRAKASIFWPRELSEETAELSIIPKLIETQDAFLSILCLDIPSIDGLFSVIDTVTLPANLFLKHLVVLSDFGGEMLQRVNSEFNMLFPKNELRYFWNKKELCYKFLSLPVKNLSNKKLGIDGKKVLISKPLDHLSKDVIALLLFGSTCYDEYTARTLSKCEVGTYLGDPVRLKEYVKQRYIYVSRITSGADTNTLGQLAQDYVRNYLDKELKDIGAEILSNGVIPDVVHSNESDRKPTSFDIVIKKDNKYCAVEVSFQVTTNSVIERKAGQSQARYTQIDSLGYKIAYVIDGAGNFQRQSAVSNICAHSHCTVAFTRKELNVLSLFIKKYFTQ